MMSCYDEWNSKHSIGIGKSLLISLFTLFLIANNLKLLEAWRWPYIQTKFKSGKSWLTWAICTIFSSLQTMLKEISAIWKTAKLPGGNKLMSHTFFVKFQVFKRNFSETIWYIGLKFSEISVMLFQFSEILFY